MTSDVPIQLIPIGKVSVTVLQHLREDLERVFENISTGVEVGPGIAVPGDAYVEDRSQYQADAFLSVLQRKSGNDRVKTLGITEKDLFSGSHNFVFGQAQSPGEVGLVSLHRLRSGTPEDEISEKYLERALKESAHELGHTLGLRHCGNNGCVMNFSNSLADVDRKNMSFCSDCSDRIGL